jgi:SnoaL-like domain
MRSRQSLSLACVVSMVLAVGTVARSGPAPAANTTDDTSGRISLSLQDRFEIHELFARYSQDLDMGSDSELGPDDLINNVFAPNGMFHDPSLCLIGSAELKTGLVSHTSHAKKTQHWPMNIVFIEGSGDHAKTHTYVIVFSGRGGSPATYHDTLVKLKGKWLIQDREVWRQGEVKHDPRCPTDLEKLER